ncbi:MAG: phosphoenolpyruvate carboxykinase domain-containing protein [bacterium]
MNWFRQDEEGNYLWPGFGDNLRVLEWILARCNNEVDAQKTAIGWVPKPKDLPLEGLDLPKKNLEKLLEVKKEDWMEDERNVEAFLDTFGSRIPPGAACPARGIAPAARRAGVVFSHDEDGAPIFLQNE